MITPADRFKTNVFKAHEQGILAYENAVTVAANLVIEDVKEHRKVPAERKLNPIGLTPEKFTQYEAESRNIIFGTAEKPGLEQQLLLARDVGEVKALIKGASEHFRKAGYFTAWEFAKTYIMVFNKTLSAANHEYRDAMRDEYQIGHGIPRPSKSPHKH